MIQQQPIVYRAGRPPTPADKLPPQARVICSVIAFHGELSPIQFLTKLAAALDSRQGAKRVLARHRRLLIERGLLVLTTPDAANQPN